MKLKILIFVVLFLVVNYSLFAQCPMCRMSVESNLNNGGSMGKTINAGILYMLVMPYLLVGTLAFLWLKNKRKAAAQYAETNLKSD